MKYIKLGIGLLFAVFMALVTGIFAEKTLHFLLPSLSRGAGLIAKVIVFIILIPLYLYLVESYFIRKEKKDNPNRRTSGTLN